MGQHVNRRKHERFIVPPMYTPICVRLLDDEATTLEGHIGPGRSVFTLANIIWNNQDPDEPGPVRMAAVFSSFARLGDRDRLIRHLVRGRYLRAA
jgi:hypothetical protein